MILILVCWLIVPTNRPHGGALILYVAMVASLAIGAFVARRLLFGRGPALAGEVLLLTIASAVFTIGAYVVHGTRWGRRRMR